jgi:hypothetical protein
MKAKIPALQNISRCPQRFGIIRVAPISRQNWGIVLCERIIRSISSP